MWIGEGGTVAVLSIVKVPRQLLCEGLNATWSLSTFLVVAKRVGESTHLAVWGLGIKLSHGEQCTIC